MAEAPACAKCGGKHFRFVKCENADAFAEKERENAAARALKVVRPEWRTDRDREIRHPVGDPLKVYPVWRTRGPQDAA